GHDTVVVAHGHLVHLAGADHPTELSPSERDGDAVADLAFHDTPPPDLFALLDGEAGFAQAGPELGLGAGLVHRERRVVPRVDPLGRERLGVYVRAARASAAEEGATEDDEGESQIHEVTSAGTIAPGGRCVTP